MTAPNPRPAKLPSPEAAVGAKVAARQGVLSSVRSDPQTGDGRYPVAWLTITAPRGAVPTATSTCQCGRNLFAAGQRRVLALIDDHARHRDLCPLRTERRTAS